MKEYSFSVEDITFLDNLLSPDNFLDFIKINGGIIKNQYTNLKKVLNHYKSIYDITLSKKTINIHLNKSYFINSYEYVVNRDYDGFEFTSSYTIIWNIERINDVINKYNIQPQKLPLSSVYNTMTHSARKNINHEHLPTALKNDVPICIIKFEPFSPLELIRPHSINNNILLLDGNHRVYSRIQANTEKSFNPFKKKYKNIMAYTLTPEQHMELMPHDDIKTLYKINSNLNYIRQYIIGTLSLNQLNSLLYII